MKTTLVLLTLLLTLSVNASEIHVRPDGPIRTLAEAQREVRKANPAMVVIHAGTYYLAAPLVLTAEDSGVTWRANEGENPVISGGVKLDLHWQPYKGAILQAKVPNDLVTEELFVNGERQILARYPNFDPKAQYFNGAAADAVSKQRVARWVDPRGGYLHAMHPMFWGGYTWRITGKDPTGELTMEGGWQHNQPGWENSKRGGADVRFVENIFEELDAPGEWFLDRKSHILYYWPAPGVEMKNATFEATRLRTLVELRGDEKNPVKNVVFRGLIFRNADRTMMETKEPVLRSDWAIYRGGAIFVNGAEDCSFEDCLLDRVGGNAIFVNNYARRIAVRGCEIVKAGASGICFLGDYKAVRNPHFKIPEHEQLLSRLDTTAGPQTNNYPSDCVVEDCLIHLTGRVEKQTAGVNIDVAQNITVRHCSIYDMPRAGINIGDGCWGGHVIEFCDIFDTVKETGDHGCFNSWGRDRWWGLKDLSRDKIMEKAETRNLPFLDACRPIVICNSRWRCDHGWDIDLDDGATNYRIYNNLCLRRGIKNREGFGRINENNITVNSTLHAFLWPIGSGDIVRHNIFFQPYTLPQIALGVEVDHNFLHVEGAATPTAPAVALQQVSRQDEHSLQGDALFVDPAHGDYTVKDGSPALAVGFKNFPMNQFGVTSPKLRAKARVPEFPVINKYDPREVQQRTVLWQGVTARTIRAGEYTVYAVLETDGGIVLLKVPAGSPAAQAGLRDGDLLQEINGTKIPNFEVLNSAMKQTVGKPLRIRYVRGQKPAETTIPSQL
ncbi:MAG: PDZ domain-containing protein [Verrucomicrobiota bacterium]